MSVWYPEKGNAFYDKAHRGQGWLFNPSEEGWRPRDLMSDADRYPRGFTPNRMREVRTALGNTRITAPDDLTQARMFEGLARSTAPADELGRIKELNLGLEARVDPDTGDASSAFGSARNYDGRINIFETAGEHAGSTLLHEIGHLQEPQRYRKFEGKTDDKIMDFEDVKNYSAEQRGVAEGQADRYKNTHYREDPRPGLGVPNRVGGYARHAYGIEKSEDLDNKISRYSMRRPDHFAAGYRAAAEGNEAQTYQTNADQLSMFEPSGEISENRLNKLMYSDRDLL